MANPLKNTSNSVTDSPIGNNSLLNNSRNQPISAPISKILTLTEACAYIGVAKPTMYKYLKEEAIPAFKYKGSRVWKFDKDKLDEWLKKQQEGGGRS